MDTHDLQRHLRQFTGSEYWFRHGLNRDVTYTDGVAFFAENAGAYWFLDIVVTELYPLLLAEDFLIVVLHVEGSKAKITADDGNGNVLWSRSIDWTSCPEGEWKFFFTNNVLLLPSEY